MVIFIWLTFSLPCLAQKAHHFNSWWVYSGEYSVSERINVSPFYSWARHDFVKNWQQSLWRISFDFKFNKQISASQGYDWVILFPYGEQPLPARRIAHRIWHQLELKNKMGIVSLSDRLRWESRIIDGKLRPRLRYRLAAKIPLTSHGYLPKISFSVFDEVFFSLGKYDKGNRFSQHRIYGGIDLGFFDHFSLSLGYMNQYIFKRSGKTESNHTLMIIFFHTINSLSK